MASVKFDNVKAEKAYAMSRYKREKKLNKFFRLLEAFVALAFLISWFSSFFHTAGEFFTGVTVVFRHHFTVFALLNLIILVVFVLSLSSNPREIARNYDFYDQYVNHSSKSTRCISSVEYSPKTTGVKLEELTDESYQDKQIICVNNAISVSPVKQIDSDHIQNKPITVSSPVEGEIVSAVSTVTKVKTYRRNKSERLEEKPRKLVLRRSETTSDVARRRKSVMDDLTNEEFKSTIEKFIAAKKKTLLQENMCIVVS